MKAVNSWKNAAGQTVIETDTGLSVLPKNWTVAQWQATQESRERGRAAAQAAQSQVAEIEAALKDTGCVALVNGVGKVAVFSVPGGADEAAPGATLSPARRRTLELELQAVRAVADDKASSAGARRMAAERAAVIEKLLALPATSGT